MDDNINKEKNSKDKSINNKSSDLNDESYDIFKKPIDDDEVSIEILNQPKEEYGDIDDTDKDKKDKKTSKKKNNIIVVIVIVVCLLLVAFYSFYRKNTPSNPSDIDASKVVNDSSLGINQVNINKVTFSFPETKDKFNKIGWKWDETSAKNNVPVAQSMNGGKIGSSPGGAVVMVYNNNKSSSRAEDCLIYQASFINPKDGSVNAAFVGGLSFTSSIEDVKERMNKLGYSKSNEVENKNILNLRYFLNNDLTNVNNYIEFYFVDNVIDTITIAVSY